MTTSRKIQIFVFGGLTGCFFALSMIAATAAMSQAKNVSQKSDRLPLVTAQFCGEPVPDSECAADLAAYEGYDLLPAYTISEVRDEDRAMTILTRVVAR
ncbi:MAG: hypothetical protein JKY10_07270 [Cohaesibacteraceae bacterium]|nr:hypothetical protein [Cohaesibacteraceae bacterium]